MEQILPFKGRGGISTVHNQMGSLEVEPSLCQNVNNQTCFNIKIPRLVVSSCHKFSALEHRISASYPHKWFLPSQEGGVRQANFLRFPFQLLPPCENVFKLYCVGDLTQDAFHGGKDGE